MNDEIVEMSHVCLYQGPFTVKDFYGQRFPSGKQASYNNN
jgi:hypothetical protein